MLVPNTRTIRKIKSLPRNYQCVDLLEWKHIMTVSYENATSLKTRHFTVSQELIFQPPGRVISQKELSEKFWDQSI